MEPHSQKIQDVLDALAGAKRLMVPNLDLSSLVYTVKNDTFQRVQAVLHQSLEREKLLDALQHSHADASRLPARRSPFAALPSEILYLIFEQVFIADPYESDLHSRARPITMAGMNRSSNRRILLDMRPTCKAVLRAIRAVLRSQILITGSDYNALDISMLHSQLDKLPPATRTTRAIYIDTDGFAKYAHRPIDAESEGLAIPEIVGITQPSSLTISSSNLTATHAQDPFQIKSHAKPTNRIHFERFIAESSVFNLINLAQNLASFSSNLTFTLREIVQLVNMPTLNHLSLQAAFLKDKPPVPVGDGGETEAALVKDELHLTSLHITTCLPAAVWKAFIKASTLSSLSITVFPTMTPYRRAIPTPGNLENEEAAKPTSLFTNVLHGKGGDLVRLTVRSLEIQGANKDKPDFLYVNDIISDCPNVKELELHGGRHSMASIISLPHLTYLRTPLATTSRLGENLVDAEETNILARDLTDLLEASKLPCMQTIKLDCQGVDPVHRLQGKFLPTEIRKKLWHVARKRGIKVQYLQGTVSHPMMSNLPLPGHVFNAQFEAAALNANYDEEEDMYNALYAQDEGDSYDGDDIEDYW